MRILPLVLAAALALPAIGFTQDKPRPFEDPNEPTKTPAGGNPTPTIIEIGIAGVAIIAVAAALAAGGGGDDDNRATAGTTGTR